MDCARGHEWAGGVQQRSRYIFFRDGYGRGTSLVCCSCRGLVYCRLTPLQVFTGAVPFDGDPALAAMLGIVNGERPPRPTHSKLTDGLWTLIQRCWDQDPHLRPEVSEVVKVLGGL